MFADNHRLITSSLRFWENISPWGLLVFWRCCDRGKLIVFMCWCSLRVASGQYLSSDQETSFLQLHSGRQKETVGDSGTINIVFQRWLSFSGLVVVTVISVCVCSPPENSSLSQRVSSHQSEPASQASVNMTRSRRQTVKAESQQIIDQTWSGLSRAGS